MDLAEATERLYSGPPAQFVATRTQLAKQARNEGDPDAAKRITELRRPTASAALLNALARTDAAAVRSLQSVGDDLRDAQQRGDGDAIRALSQKRRQVIGAVLAAVARIAGERGQPLSESIRGEIESSLAASILDPAAAQELAAGTLTGALQQIGFGDWSPAAEVGASPPPRPALRAVPDLPEPASKAPGRSQRTADRDAQDDRLQAAALERAEAATAALEKAQAQDAAAQQRITDLQGQIDSLRNELVEAAVDARRWHEAHRKAARDASAAMRRLASHPSAQGGG